MSQDSPKEKKEKIPYGGDTSQEGTAFIPYFPKDTKLGNSTSLEGAKVGLVRDADNGLETHADWMPVNIQQMVDEEIARQKQLEKKQEVYEHTPTKDEMIAQIEQMGVEQKEIDRDITRLRLETVNTGLQIINTVLTDVSDFIHNNPDFIPNTIEKAKKTKQIVKKTAQSAGMRIKSVFRKNREQTEETENESELVTAQSSSIEEQDIILDKDNRIERSKKDIQDAFMFWINAKLRIMQAEKDAQAAEEYLRSSKVGGNEDFIITDESMRALESILRQNKELMEPQYIQGVLNTLRLSYAPEEIQRIEESIPFDVSYIED